jgi:signal transduction histidine kinase
MIEEELRQAGVREQARANELKALMDAVPAMIWISRDPMCKEMVGNRYGYEFLGMWEGANISKTAPEEDLRIQPYRNFKNGQEIPSNELPMQVAAGTGQGTKDYEFDLVFSDGVVKNILGNVVPLVDQAGTPSGAVAVFVDITERKQMEEELRESRERFHASIESLMEAFVLMPAVRQVEPDGRRGRIIDFRIEYVNDSACHLSQVGREQLLGHTLLELLPGHRSNVLLDRYAAVVERDEPLAEKAMSHLDPFGRQTVGRAFDIHASRFGDGVVVTWDDVTQQERIKNEREHALNQMEIHERLKEQAERDRQNYAREIHDGPVQTLHAIQYAISFLKEGYSEPQLRVELDEIELNIKKAIQELRQVINELRPPSVIRFGLARAIEMHVLDLREQHPEFTWNYRLASGRDGFGEATSLTLFRIYQEAVRNILRHSHATKATISYRLLKEKAVLEIRDDGVGMPEEYDPNLLVQSKHFGLAGIRERAESVGAQVVIRSQPEKGLSLKVVVPLGAGRTE